MISSLLIANRGEIARRIIRTAKRMGIRTIAVYSSADENAPHVREADHSVFIGPALALQSYLVPENIITAARDSGADAIHPGYGFLSENAAFAEAVIAAGFTWVGPPPSAIRAMGLKDAAKKLMLAAGVPVTPGYMGEDQSEVRLQSEADKIGYPVLIKAVAGGGGKGMRKVESAEDFSAALQSCRREAKSSFADDKILLEKYINRPRHIEVQVFSDKHGNTIHLFERDCSLQRRHQKVIEEAPAPGMDDVTRASICEAAVKGARAVGYEGAGTIEFIADGSQGLSAERIWFMEMNTRLQVEHLVTEAVTGIDLVEWQLRIASGEALPLAQDQISLNGHAVEARLYAENPATGFMPSTGILTHFHMPGDLRIDSAVEQGSEVSSYYDPMIAKLIAHAPTRKQAILKLARASSNVEVWPVRTNSAFLVRCLESEDFIEARIDTGFIESRLDTLAPQSAVPAPILQSAALESILPADKSPWENLKGFQINSPPEFEVSLQFENTILTAKLDGGKSTQKIQSHRIDRHLVFFDRGEAYAFTKPMAAAAAHEEVNDGTIRSPMPGRVTVVQVAAGDSVSKGQPLVTLEAMKMENVLVAPFDGIVINLSVSVDEQVAENFVLVRLQRKG